MTTDECKHTRTEYLAQVDTTVCADCRRLMGWTATDGATLSKAVMMEAAQKLGADPYRVTVLTVRPDEIVIGLPGQEMRRVKVVD